MSLKTLRKKARLTQKKLGALTGFDDSTIGNYETGAIPMSPDFVKRMAAHFKVSESEITANSDDGGEVLRLCEQSPPYGGIDEWRSRALLAEAKLQAIRTLIESK